MKTLLTAPHVNPTASTPTGKGHIGVLSVSGSSGGKARVIGGHATKAAWLNMSDTLIGVAIGMGLGWLNATFLGIPGWANILLMIAFAVAGELAKQSYRGDPA